jgi:hypothetical protein
MMVVMELTGDVRAAILRVLEEFSPTDGDSTATAQASTPVATGGPAMIRSSPLGAAEVRHGEHDETTGRQDQSFTV